MANDKVTFHKFVRRSELDEHLAQGWVASDDLAGTHHDKWSVLCHWPDNASPREMAYAKDMFNGFVERRPACR